MKDQTIAKHTEKAKAEEIEKVKPKPEHIAIFFDYALQGIRVPDFFRPNVLEGKRKLAGLYYGLKGFKGKKEKHMYLNITNQSGHPFIEKGVPKRKFEFKFFEEEKKEFFEKDGKRWFKVGEILKYKEQEELQELIDAESDSGYATSCFELLHTLVFGPPAPEVVEGLEHLMSDLPED